MKEALAELKKGASTRSVSKKFNIAARTLRRHHRGEVKEPGRIKLGRFRAEFTPDQEEIFVEKVRNMERMLYGLTLVDIRRLAFEYAEKLGIHHRFSQESRMAGKEWLRGFVARNPGLSVRKPEATSIARAVGFNRAQVTKFFDLYKRLAAQHEYTPLEVWNMDETGISSVQKPGNILAAKGKKRVGKVTSTEKGKTVTVICAANATGQFVPPMFIFGRARLPESLMNGAPPGSIAACTTSGWTDQECFLVWLKHFIRSVKPSKMRRHVLVLDGHHSHKCLEALELASENGVDIITLPPHTTHRLQPLDVAWFKSLKSSYNSEADRWLSQNPGRRITDYEVAAIFSKAYIRCASMDKITKGFTRTGLWPIDDGVFTEDDFAASFVTEEPEPSASKEAAAVATLQESSTQQASCDDPASASMQGGEIQSGKHPTSYFHAAPRYEIGRAHV